MELLFFFLLGEDVAGEGGNLGHVYPAPLPSLEAVTQTTI